MQTRRGIVSASRVPRAVLTSGGVRTLCLILADHGLASVMVSDTHVAIDVEGELACRHAAGKGGVGNGVSVDLGNSGLIDIDLVNSNLGMLKALCTFVLVVISLRKASAIHLSDGLNAEVNEAVGVLGSTGAHTDTKL